MPVSFKRPSRICSGCLPLSFTKLSEFSVTCASERRDSCTAHSLYGTCQRSVPSLLCLALLVLALRRRYAMTRPSCSLTAVRSLPAPFCPALARDYAWQSRP